MNDDQRKHLEMVQTTISRMAAQSFAVKGWSVTAVSALLAFAAGTRHQWVAVVALLPTVVFWGLDSYYVSLERRYRALFDAAADLTTPLPRLYSLDVAPYTAAHPWRDAAFSHTVLPLHAVVVLTVAAVVLAVGRSPEPLSDPIRVRIRDTVLVRVAPVGPVPCGTSAPKQPTPSLNSGSRSP